MAKAFSTEQKTVTTTASVVSAAKNGRDSVTIMNRGTTEVFIGTVGVTTATGFPLPGVVGASITIPTDMAVYAIVAAGTANVSVLSSH
jgi:hypothetical protein